MSGRTKLAVVIVTWNVRNLVLDCLRSLYADLDRTAADARVWLVDNASSDGTLEAVRRTFPLSTHENLHLIASMENLGFALGNNLALRAMGFPDGERADLPDYVLLLNPDTIVESGALQALVDGMSATGAGLGGAQLSYGDRSFQHSAFALPGLRQIVFDLFPLPARLREMRLNGRYPRSWYDRGEPFDVGHPLGATFTLRSEAILDTGLFDEQFHLYCEEIDWAIRIHEAGWRVVCIPSAEVIHLAGQSTSQVRAESLVKLWRARLQLYRKHYPPVKRWLAVQLVRAGMNAQIKRVARDSSLSDEVGKQSVDAYREILKLTRQKDLSPVQPTDNHLHLSIGQGE